MTDAAAGIHAHDRYKLGRKPPKDAPALMLGDFLTGEVPAHPATADHIGSLAFGLYGNDRYGDCGPTSVANDRCAVTGGLLGREEAPSQDDVFALYRESGNPSFDPKTDADDNGVDMQTMCEALLANGIGGVKPLCFAKVDVTSDAEIDAAVSIFGGVLWGVNLQVAQQAQSDASNPTWDYQPSGDWGGHAVVHLGYDEETGTDRVISWAENIGVTAAFRREQLEEAWVLVWPENVTHPAFQEGVDAQALADAYHALTGETIPDLPAPAPTPAPVPGGHGSNGPFLVGPVSDRVAARLAALAEQKGMTVEALILYHVNFASRWR